MRKKKLILFTLDKIVRDANRRELEDFFGDIIDIEAYTIYESIKPNSLEANLILTISDISSNKIQGFMKKETEILQGNRTILYESYKKLRALPAGTRALVISTTKFTSLDLAHFLMKIGIPNVDFFPVYKGMDEIPKADIAIIPLFLNENIDIGDMRILDLNTRRITTETFKAIMLSLNIKSPYLDKKLHEISKTLVNIDLIDGTLSKISTLENILSNTLHEIDDGVIVTSDNNKIMYYNSSLLKMLKYESMAEIPEFLNKDVLPEEIYTQVINNNELDNLICYSQELNKHFIVNKKHIIVKGNKSGYIIVINETSNIQLLEKKIRGVLHKKGHIAKYTFENIIGQSEIIKSTILKAKKIAVIDKPILILGESGTGKELFSQSIHNSSQRSDKPFLAINCAALTAELLESELFGYVEGAFTGARKDGKSGLFEHAHNGTLFLDEIGDMPLDMQVKLLRVLQEGEIRRIGSGEIIPVNVRIIAATNKNLEELIEQGKFRLDLYYRLNVFTLCIPPLRDRIGDIPIIMNDILRKLAEKDGTLNIKSISTGLMKTLLNHTWYGNIRELTNCVEYMYYMGNDVLEPSDLPPAFKINSHILQNSMADDILTSFSNDEKKIIHEILKIILNRDIGRRKILSILKERGFDISEYKLRMILSFLKEQSIITYNSNKTSAAISSNGKLLFESMQGRMTKKMSEE